MLKRRIARDARHVSWESEHKVAPFELLDREREAAETRYIRIDSLEMCCRVAFEQNIVHICSADMDNKEYVLAENSRLGAMPPSVTHTHTRRHRDSEGRRRQPPQLRARRRERARHGDEGHRPRQVARPHDARGREERLRRRQREDQARNATRAPARVEAAHAGRQCPAAHEGDRGAEGARREAPRPRPADHRGTDRHRPRVSLNLVAPDSAIGDGCQRRRRAHEDRELSGLQTLGDPRPEPPTPMSCGGSSWQCRWTLSLCSASSTTRPDDVNFFRMGQRSLTRSGVGCRRHARCWSS